MHRYRSQILWNLLNVSKGSELFLVLDVRCKGALYEIEYAIRSYRHTCIKWHALLSASLSTAVLMVIYSYTVFHGLQFNMSLV